MKIAYKILIIFLTIILISLIYFSTIGIKTDRFNSNIVSQIKKIEPNLEIKLNSVSAKLNPFKFTIRAKTIGTDLTYKDKVIKIESIKSNISLKSLLSNKFVLSEVYISTKTLKINDFIKITMFIDSENYNFKMKFLGYENLKTKFGEINCLKFRPIVESERIFNNSESLTLWISNDKNKIPIKINRFAIKDTMEIIPNILYLMIIKTNTKMKPIIKENIPASIES